LLSHEAIESMLRQGTDTAIGRDVPPLVLRELRKCLATVRERIGPASSPRVVFDLLAEPLAGALGFRAVTHVSRSDTVEAILQAGNVAAAALLVTVPGLPATAVWRLAVRCGVGHDTRWTLCLSAPFLRLVDTSRAYGRRFAEFDLDSALANELGQAVLWSLVRAEALTPGDAGSRLDRVIAACERHRAGVRVSLRSGVFDALLQLTTGFRRSASRRHADAEILREALIVIHRMLFLLFAEARGLVPAWHPTYRDGYTIETLRLRLGRGGRASGLWEALQAMARLAHRGCRAGTLRVPPFNGRLFSPADAPLADSLPLDDGLVATALEALTTRKGRDGREGISYADLGVEQLGAVYEHLLDYDLAAAGAGAAALRPSGRRKATGSFYTPRVLTEFLVRRTLSPLVETASPEQILSLRVLDPSMGSGAFLVAACRYLAAAYEQALIRDGVLAAGDIREDDRASFRRAVAQRCLFGVDLNPMAVQLGRLSLWLATLAADKPLSFFDHHLRVGNSLVGTSAEDIARNPAPGVARPPARDLPLFEIDRFRSSIEAAVGLRKKIVETPDDTIAQVRSKERALASLMTPGAPLPRWKLGADVWCAAWYPEARQPAGRATFRDVLDRIMDGSGALPAHLADPIIGRARAVAAEQRFFHWPFEFPEVFYDRSGAPLPDPGFDAIVGNPPWEVLREEGPAAGQRRVQHFTRSCGLFRMQGRGHGNLYQLFLERTAGLIRRGGRAGMILPSGFALDHACGVLRQHLLDRTDVDTFTTIENRDEIFPIHRALKFLLLTFTAGGSTRQLPCRIGLRSPGHLETVPDSGVDPESIAVPRALIERLSPGSFAIPEIRAPLDLEIVSSISARIPALEDPQGWGVHFGRELNATDDRPHFDEGGSGLPVLEGKQLHPFAVDTGAVRFTIDEHTAARLLDRDRTFGRPRLAYRDVASASNRVTLIAALVPAGAVTTHTLFCLKDSLDLDTQHFLCGIFNSCVANYLIRMRVVTHVTAAITARLPVPGPRAAVPSFGRIARLSRAISQDAGHDHSTQAARVARLNAAAAEAYGLSARQFEHVLGTFPLIPASDRQAALRSFVARLDD
jgi:hypothetical protein